MAVAEQVEPMKFVFNVDNSTNISHVSLFILPDTPFDPNYSALVYFQIPYSPTAGEFKLLGKLSPAKPSAIFRIRNNKPLPLSQIEDDVMVDEEEEVPKIANLEDTLVIGISIEPNIQAEQLLEEERRSRSQRTITADGNVSAPKLSAGEYAARHLEETATLANKIVSNAYNYLSGFVDDDNKVSLKVLDGWWKRFREKLQNDPKFLDN